MFLPFVPFFCTYLFYLFGVSFFKFNSLYTAFFLDFLNPSLAPGFFCIKLFARTDFLLCYLCGLFVGKSRGALRNRKEPFQDVVCKSFLFLA